MQPRSNQSKVLQDLENYIYELLPQLPHLQSLQEEFYPFYVFTAVRYRSMEISSYCD